MPFNAFLPSEVRSNIISRSLFSSFAHLKSCLFSRCYAPGVASGVQWMPGANEVLGCPVNKSMATFFGMPLPYILDVQCHNLFLLFFTSFPLFLSIYLHFCLRNLGPWIPPGWMPGAVAPPALPLYATGSSASERLMLGEAHYKWINRP